MACNKAEIAYYSAQLSSDWGNEWATKLFGAEAIESLPKYQRGKNKGKTKGYVHWGKAVKGGWSRSHGGVVRPGLVEAWIGLSQHSLKREALAGEWLGRTQALSASSTTYLFEEGRERHRKEAEQARQDGLAMYDSLPTEDGGGFKP